MVPIAVLLARCRMLTQTLAKVSLLRALGPMLVEVLECLLVRFRVGFLNGGLDGCLVDLVIVECFHLAFPRTTTVLLLFVTLDVLLAVLPAATH